MPDLIDVNTNQKATDLNVPILRQRKFLALLFAYLTPTVKLQGDIKDNLLAGVSYPAYSGSTAYVFGDRVSVGRISYECIQANTGAAVTDTNYWYMVNDDNIGMTEKLNYNCSKMQLEYILNKRFNNLTHIDPPYSAAEGNIYIETNSSLPRIAWIGRNGAASSYIKPLSSNNFYYHPKNFNYTPNENYFIWVPHTILDLLGYTPPNTPDGIKVIRNEVDKYNAVGLTYNVQGY